MGLANPGAEYDSTRHNVGGEVVRELARRHGVELRAESKLRSVVGTWHTEAGPVTLAVPTVYMNESGAALAPLVRRSGVAIGDVVICHDELDLTPGRLQLKRGGGLAGHNGLRSIAQSLSGQDFVRLRIGIGKPPHKDAGADYVLKKLRGATLEEQNLNVARAADVLDAFVESGFDAAQRLASQP